MEISDCINFNVIKISFVFLFHFKVLTALIPKLQPGCDPNPHLLMTLGHLSCANVTQCVPIIKVAFNIMIPMMPSTRSEQLRIALAFGESC